MESYLDDDRYSEENKGDLQRDPSTAVQIQVGPTGQKIRSIAVTQKKAGAMATNTKSSSIQKAGEGTQALNAKSSTVQSASAGTQALNAKTSSVQKAGEGTQALNAKTSTVQSAGDGTQAINAKTSSVQGAGDGTQAVNSKTSSVQKAGDGVQCENQIGLGLGDEAEGKMWIPLTEDLLAEARQKLDKLPVDIITKQETHWALEDAKINFIDLDFPPVESSIYPPSVGQPFDSPIVWKRPACRMEVLGNGISPTDIKQGLLGDCYFMSALSSLAEKSYIVERMFSTDGPVCAPEYCEQGFYWVNFYKNGEWHRVTVDDYFPCSVNGGPIFSTSNGGLWVLLIEKAYAKLHGSYWALRSGQAFEAMMDLTGYPMKQYLFDDAVTQQLIRSGKLFGILDYHYKAGHMISVTTSGEDHMTEKGGAHEGEGGLVPGHCYSVINVANANGNQLFKIRNPWGHFEWQGDWGDKSDKWTSKLKKELQFTDEDDGCFWMCMQDFLVQFDSVHICMTQQFAKQDFKNYMVTKINDVSCNPKSKNVYEIENNDTQNIYIGLHQEDERIQNLNLRKPYIPLGVSVFKKDYFGEVEFFQNLDLSRTRQVQINLEEAERATYIIVPRTSGCTLGRPANAEQENIEMLDANGEFHPLVEMVLKDLYRRLGWGIKWSPNEYQQFYARLGRTLTWQEGQAIATKFCPNSNKITNLRGYLKFMKDSIETNGEEAIYQWLEKWGYDRDFYLVESRTVSITIHFSGDQSKCKEIINSETDYENLANMALLKKEGEVLEENSFYKLVGICPKTTHLEDQVFTLGIENVGKQAIEVSLDCSQSENMICSVPSGKVVKVLQPGALEFYMYVEALPDVTTVSLVTDTNHTVIE